MKKVIIILFVILLTGCRATVESNVNKDGSVTEVVNISENINNVLIGEQTYTEYVNDYIDFYKYTLDEEGYTYSSSITDSEIIVTLTKQFSDVCSYFNNSLFVKTSSNNLSCINKDGNYEIEGDIGYFVCGDDCMEPPEVDNATLTVNLKGKALSSNAPSVDGNSYTWNFDSSLDNKLELVVKDDVTILESITNHKPLLIFGVVFLIIIILSFTAFVLLKKYRSNKFDY